MTLLNKSLISALSFLFFLAVNPVTSAAENPFGMTDASATQMQLADSQGKCGEGKCGDSMKKKEGKCGDSMKKKEGKCGEGKCGEGKCGDSKKDDKKGKCGEGKCGGK